MVHMLARHPTLRAITQLTDDFWTYGVDLIKFPFAILLDTSLSIVAVLLYPNGNLSITSSLLLILTKEMDIFLFPKDHYNFTFCGVFCYSFPMKPFLSFDWCLMHVPLSYWPLQYWLHIIMPIVFVSLDIVMIKFVWCTSFIVVIFYFHLPLYVI